VVQEDATHPGLIWVQCPDCQEIKPIESRAASEACPPEPSDEKPGPPPGPHPTHHETDFKRVVRHYRRGERFVAGEWIFHPEWNDKGQVIEKCRSTGGREVIVVSFRKIGVKRLVSNCAK